MKLSALFLYELVSHIKLVIISQVCFHLIEIELSICEARVQLERFT